MMSFFISTGLLMGQGSWARTYGGTSYDYAWSITQTSDSGCAVAGWTYSFGAGLSDFLVFKLSSNGTLQWARTFGGAGQDEAWSITQTSDGGYVVAGETWGFGAGDCDLLVLRLASDGTLQWARTFGGTSYDCVYHATQTSDGSYVMVGETKSFGAGNSDLFVLKLASNGTLQWARTFGGIDYDGALSVTQTSDSGCVVAGWTYSFGAGNYDLLVLKLASNGTLQWARTFGGAGMDYAWSIIRTSDDCYVAAGETGSFGAGNSDILVLKLASNGTLQWAGAFGGTSDDYAYSMTQTTDGGFAIAGETYGFGVVEDDFLVLKLNPDGSLDWARTFGGTSMERAWSITQTTDGGCAVAGETYSFGAGYYDCLVLNLDSEGNYPGCAAECTPTTTIPSLSTSSPSVGAVCSPSSSSPGLAVTTPSLTITDACEPLYRYEREINPGPQTRITCSLLPGAVLFVSPWAIPIKIYSSDGRLGYSGNLDKGQNRIPLEKGVYLWKAGACKGKVVVR
jgi:uncharacterized delta-60 repeat protein